MPISPIVLQRRHAELGRIRLGDKGDRGQPQKLSRFRFTSSSEAYINDLAALYGGTPQQWDNSGKPEWEVYTTASSIPVIAVKGGLSQWLEYWQGGGCLHRCDGSGDLNVITGEACDLEEKVKTRVRGQDMWVNPHTEAKPTTRLSVMLPELDAIGVWRMESHGWNAAAEIPAVAELAQYVGDLVPAVLHLVERRTVKDGKTSRFVVPVLDLRIGQARLREIVQSVANGTELEAAGRTPAAIEAPAQTDEPRMPTLTDIAAASTVDAVFNIYRYLDGHGALTDELKAACLERREELNGGEPERQPDGGGVVDAELVPDAEAVWAEIVKAGGERQMSLPDLEQDVALFLNGGDASGKSTAADADGAELQAYLNILLARAA